MVKKKSAWYVEPSLLEFLRRRDQRFEDWAISNGVKSEEKLLAVCSSLGLRAPAWDSVKEFLGVPTPEAAIVEEPRREEERFETTAELVSSYRNRKRKKLDNTPEAVQSDTRSQESGDADP